MAVERGRPATARRDLKTLRAAVNHYAREYGLTAAPVFTLPDKPVGRERWLTRAEGAALLRAARANPKRAHLARFILIGLYIGTRHKATLALQWLPNTTGGWIDLERGVLHRRGLGELQTKKRRPAMRLPPRLIAHLERWRALDQGLRYVVHYDGRPITRIEKAFRSARTAAGLDDAVVPHTLRHTRATWLMQAGVSKWDAAQSLGMTEAQLEATYGHHHPDFQKSAAEAY